MDFFSSLAKGSKSTDEKDAGGESAPSTTDLFASAKVLADAAQSQFNKTGEAVDNKKVADAAADVLDAAQHYGKLDETQGIGQYVAQAETYLHKYGSPDPPAPAAAEKAPVEEPAVEKPPVAEEPAVEKPPVAEEPAVEKPPVAEEAAVEKPTAVDTEEAKPPAPAVEEKEEAEKAPVKEEEGEKKGSEGYGEYVKMAEGFLNKGESKTEGEGGNSGADYLKMAGDFLNKK